MMDSKALSKAIRMRKKGSLRPDMDSAGQEGLPPEEALAVKLNSEVSDVTSSPDHDPASASEMGEGESSQEIPQLKKAMARINRYFDSL